MTIKTLKIDKEAKELTMVVSLDKDPKPSKSGKTLTVATTSGIVPVDAKWNKAQLKIGLNIMIPNPNYNK